MATVSHASREGETMGKRSIASSKSNRGTRRKPNEAPRSKPAARPREYPRPPFPRQHQEKPGSEADLSPRPQYEGQAYRPAGKLQGQVALITGGDSGIGRSVAV